MANIIHSTVDNQRVHISSDGLYMGSINSYNNIFTRAFAWVFGLSVSVTINGKQRSLNKTDYASWINSHTDTIAVTKKDVQRFTSLCLLQIRPPAINSSPMNANLSYFKTSSLFKKLVRNLHNPQVAKKYIFKGAALNQHFWSRGAYGNSFGSMKDTLPEAAIPPTSMTRFYPLLYAAQYTPDLCPVLRNCGANPNLTGERVQFARTILYSAPQTTLEPSISRIETHHRRPGYGTYAVTHRTRAHLDINTRIITRFQDEETKLDDLLFNDRFQTVIHRPVARLNTLITPFERVVDSYRTRLI